MDERIKVSVSKIPLQDLLKAVATALKTTKRKSTKYSRTDVSLATVELLIDVLDYPPDDTIEICQKTLEILHKTVDRFHPDEDVRNWFASEVCKTLEVVV